MLLIFDNTTKLLNRFYVTYFYCSKPCNNLSSSPSLKHTTNDTHVIDPKTQIDDTNLSHGLVKSDWVGDSNHCHSVTDTIIKYAGETVYFEIKI